MKAAIYARYSSDNQREQSIEDQVRVCQNYAREKNIEILNEHIYFDEARSGSIRNRAGLDALMKSSEEKKFDIVLVDDSSRISRDVYYFNQLLCRFIYLKIRLISISDGLDTQEENAKVGYQFRSIFNELYLTDLKKKTHRGQMGQIIRGFMMAGVSYGYESVPVGDLRPDKKGRLRADGYTQKIIPEEARVIKKIYTDFVEGKSLNAIVRVLNRDKVPCRKGLRGGWNISTISRILKKEKYKGTYIWNRTTSVKDPMTGKRKKIIRPKSEWVIQEKKELVIVEPELWEKAQKRFQEIKNACPIRKSFGRKQKSYVEANPTHLLSGNIVCGNCGGAIVLVSGKSAGYYGCHNARRGSCDNKMLINRKKIEDLFMDALREKVLRPEHLQLVYQKVAKQIQKQFSHIPEEIRLKKMELNKAETRIHRFIEFIAEAKATASIATALENAESKAKMLTCELKSLERAKEEAFEPPPLEWIGYQIGKIQEALESKTEKSALLLRKLVGKITLTPKVPEVGKPYYHAKSKLKSFAILKGKTHAASDVGSNWSQWWRWGESNPLPKLHPYPAYMLIQRLLSADKTV